MDAFVDMARARGLILIEDAAQAHGAEFRGRRVGAFGAAGVFSLYPTKNLMTGEGGLLLTNDAAVADRARLLVNCGSRTQYVYEVLGYNFRMTEIAGALGAVQLPYLDDRNARRRQNAARLTAGLSDLDWLVLPYVPPGCLHVFHQYTIRVPRVRDRLIRHLDAHGIGNRVYYPMPIHRTPLYERQGYGSARCPEADRAAAEVVSIPVHPGVDDEALERVIRTIRSFDPRG
jgi:perosamine synthetase